MCEGGRAADDTQVTANRFIWCVRICSLFVYCSASRYDPCLASPVPTQGCRRTLQRWLRIAGTLAPPGRLRQRPCHSSLPTGPGSDELSTGGSLGCGCSAQFAGPETKETGYVFFWGLNARPPRSLRPSQRSTPWPRSGLISTSCCPLSAEGQLHASPRSRHSFNVHLPLSHQFKFSFWIPGFQARLTSHTILHY